MEIMYLFFILVVAALLGLIPGNIAKKKGYSFALWWFYGWMLFIVAIIHVNLIPDKNAQQPYIRSNSISNYPPSSIEQSAIEELKKYKELFDQGVITEAEFQTKKEQLLKLI